MRFQELQAFEENFELLHQDRWDKADSDIYVLHPEMFIPSMHRCALISAYIHLLHMYCKTLDDKICIDKLWLLDKV